MKRLMTTTLACVALLVAVCSPPASAVPDVFRTFAHNVEHTNLGATLYVTAPSNRPLTVGLQELCQDEYNSIHNTLNARGYISNTYVPGNNISQCRDCPVICTERGHYVSAFSVGARAPGPNALVGRFTDQSGQGSPRGFACVSGTYGRTWWSCSTHLESMQGSITERQSENMAAIGRVLSANGHAAIVAGDFNRTPGQPGMATWYSSYAEADSTVNHPTYPNDSSRNRKYDYIFSTGLITDAAFGVATISCDTPSDHCNVHGWQRFWV